MDDFSNSTWTTGIEYLYIKGSNHFQPKKLGIICLIQSIPTSENKIICNIIGKVFFGCKKNPTNADLYFRQHALLCYSQTHKSTWFSSSL